MSSEHDTELYKCLCDGNERQANLLVTYTKINPNMGLQGAMICKLNKYIYRFIEIGADKKLAMNYVIYNKDIHMAAYLIENGCEYLKEVPKRWGVPLINLGINVEKLKTHSSYPDIITRIFYHKQKTYKTLEQIFPKELLILISSFQQF